MAKKVGKTEVVIKDAKGNQATAVLTFEYDPDTCEGSIISIGAKTPRAALGIPWKIGFGVSSEISMSSGSLTGTKVDCRGENCEGHKCDFTVTASWTARAILTIFIQWYDRQATSVGTGSFSTECECNS